MRAKLHGLQSAPEASHFLLTPLATHFKDRELSRELLYFTSCNRRERDRRDVSVNDAREQEVFLQRAQTHPSCIIYSIIFWHS